MRMRVGGLVLVTVLGGAKAWGSEPVCFRSPGEAAAQNGVRGVTGYRLESERRDVLAGTVWAVVRSCEHPERPAALVLAGVSMRARGAAGGANDRGRSLALLAGAKVRVVLSDDVSRIEMNGLAQGSGAVGERVLVRLMPPNAEPGAREQFATGVVRGAGLVEVGSL